MMKAETLRFFIWNLAWSTRSDAARKVVREVLAVEYPGQDFDHQLSKFYRVIDGKDRD